MHRFTRQLARSCGGINATGVAGVFVPGIVKMEIVENVAAFVGDEKWSAITGKAGFYLQYAVCIFGADGINGFVHQGEIRSLILRMRLVE